MGGEQARLFLALWPPPTVRQALLDWLASAAWPPGAKPTPADRLHLTLHFIGMVPAARVAALLPALAVPGEGFTLHFGQLDAWPRGLPVLRPQALPPAAAALHARLADALRAAGLPVEARAWRPHVTLARDAPGAVLAPPPPLRWQADRYALVQSDRGYRTLATYPLR